MPISGLGSEVARFSISTGVVVPADPDNWTVYSDHIDCFVPSSTGSAGHCIWEQKVLQTSIKLEVEQMTAV